eukprot:COSAG02_NODE_2233_length_9425_cov_2.280399_5_plen_105_part_00
MGHSTPWEAFAEQPHLVAALLFLLALQWFIANRFVVKEVELHLYQYQFLKKLGGAEGASAGLQIIISRAMTEPRFLTLYIAVTAPAQPLQAGSALPKAPRSATR